MDGDNKELLIHYKKLGNYRTYHADGFFGGPTPRGMLYIEPFIDRGITPKVTKLAVSTDGQTLTEEVVECLEGAIREIECGIIIDLNTAKELQRWLGEKITDIEKLKSDNKGK